MDPWPYPEETTHHPFSGTHPEGQRIDWILVHKDFEVNKVEIIKDNINGKYPSDHFPVLIEIK